MTMLTRRGALLSGLALAGCATMTPAPAPRVWPATAWRRLPTEAFRGKQDDVFFLNARRGWYGSGTGKVYRTDDGGESWAKVTDRPGTYVRALGFLDERRGFLGNVGAGVYPTGTDATPLYVTADGGESWTPAAVTGPPLAGVCGIDVVRGGGRTVVHAGGRVGGTAVLARSEDHGATWASQDLAPLTGMILDVKFLSPQVGFIAGATSSNSREANPVVLKTSDGGRSWRRVYQGARPVEITWKLSFPSPRVGYVSIQSYNPDPATAQRYVAKTTNGGETWTELPVVSDLAWREFGIGFVDERYGFVGGTTYGMETRDGGASWTRVDMGPAVNKIRILRDDGAVRAYAVGAEVRTLQIPA